MNDPLPDRVVLLALLVTLFMVFSLIFMFRAPQNELQPSIQWRETPGITSESLQI